MRVLSCPFLPTPPASPSFPTSQLFVTGQLARTLRYSFTLSRGLSADASHTHLLVPQTPKHKSFVLLATWRRGSLLAQGGERAGGQGRGGEWGFEKVY